MSEREQLLKKLSAYAFAAYDWNLYLDTHPNDTDAIAMFRKMADKANELREEFRSKFGPLTAAESTNTERWDWIDNPWPWDNI
ncbi:MAG: spore coat protein CotJB [Clostridiales bacterium]|nr:spore coat protein CotJB [Clostridiales bacterium]